MANEGPRDQRPIVVGWDGTDRARGAIALAGLLARELGARVEIVYVGEHYVGSPEFVPAIEAAARRLLENAPIELLDGAPAGTQVVLGTSPARGLQHAAEDLSARLIVLGSTHLGRAGRVLPGSVAQHLLHGSPCAVAVAPVGYGVSAPDSLRTIAVAYDASPEARRALRDATELATRAEATVRVITVVPPLSYGWAGAGIALAPVELQETQRERSREALHEAVSELPAHLRADGRLREGAPPRQIVEECEAGVDLLVMGSRGYGGIGRVLLGSVSSDVLKSAPCPVIIVPQTAVRDADEPETAHAAGVTA